MQFLYSTFLRQVFLCFLWSLLFCNHFSVIFPLLFLLRQVLMHFFLLSFFIYFSRFSVISPLPFIYVFSYSLSAISLFWFHCLYINLASAPLFYICTSSLLVVSVVIQFQPFILYFVSFLCCVCPSFFFIFPLFYICMSSFLVVFVII